jgi:predicted adenine nucleotide alpha hydrolase (AANH) superfamily ATPase
LRFFDLAQTAFELGFDTLATSLSVSPWQFIDLIAEELERAARSFGLKSLFDDYRCDYQEATQISRELGMYRQNYCGCLYSQAEAKQEKAARRRK